MVVIERKSEKARDINIDRARITTMITRALEARQNKEGVFGQEIFTPERQFIELAQAYGEQQGSEVFALHALFFLSMTLFAGDTTRQLRFVSDPDRFRSHVWLFEPEIVNGRSEEEVMRETQQLIREGYNARALSRWKHNAGVIAKKYDGDLRNFFAQHGYDATSILNALVGPKRKIGWEGFHRFGPKLGRLFLQWVNQYGLAELKNMEGIGVPVDFQVARLVIQTGGIKLFEPTHKAIVLDEILTPTLAEICQTASFSPQLVSETLWLVGNRCCNNYAHSLCPLTHMCDRLISRRPIDEDGLFDPQDVGRYKSRRTMMAERKREKLIAAGQLELPSPGYKDPQDNNRDSFKEIFPI